MARFQKGQSGNPAGRPPGADSAFRKILEGICNRHETFITAKLEQFLSVDENFKWMLEKKAQFELKSMPNEIEVSGNKNDLFVENIVKKLGADDGEKA